MVNKRTEVEWARIVEEYRASGSSMASWCREHGVSAKTLGSHVKQFRDGSTKKKMRGLSEWESLIKEQEDSGLSRFEWCDKNGVNISAMDSAQHRIEKRAKRDLPTGWLSVDVDSDRDSGSDRGRDRINTDTVFTDDGAVKARSSGHVLPMVAGEVTVDDLAAVSKGDGEEVTMVSDVTHEGARAESLTTDARSLGIIKIRLGLVEIEADVEYPCGSLATIVERLVLTIADTHNNERAGVTR